MIPYSGSGSPCNKICIFAETKNLFLLEHIADLHGKMLSNIVGNLNLRAHGRVKWSMHAKGSAGAVVFILEYLTPIHWAPSVVSLSCVQPATVRSVV